MEILKHKKQDWDIHMLKIAKLCAEMSKDPSTKVGSVISSNNKVIATGYNGFPPDVPDYKEWYEDRKKKYSIIIHAEENAIQNANCDITKFNNLTVYTYPLKPCKDCHKILQEHGVTRYVSIEHKIVNDFCLVCKKKSNECSNIRWPDACEVEIIPYDLL